MCVSFLLEIDSLRSVVLVFDPLIGVRSAVGYFWGAVVRGLTKHKIYSTAAIFYASMNKFVSFLRAHLAERDF